jgi:predicted nucleic acid-binding protein
LIVVDTNLILGLAVKAVTTPHAEAVWRKDMDWVAPPVWESEFRSGLLGMIRAGKISVRAAIPTFSFAVQNVQTLNVSTSAVLRLAESYGLTAYDAEFAALGEWLECKIVSFDDDLLRPGLAVHPKHF